MSKASPVKKMTAPFDALLGRFRRDDDGGMVIFSLFLFVLILWFGGMAVDYMRFETVRAKLTATRDRAALAAADLDQTLPPADVVRDYFEKAGMLQFLDGDPIVDEGLNYRIVTVKTSADMPMLFADLPRVFAHPFSPGLTTMNVSGTSAAEERVTNVEVSLILDVSGSMGSNNRFTNLVPAAHTFIDTILANNGNPADGLVSLSIVPYAAVVNPGEELASYFSLTSNHNYSDCIRIEDNQFDNTDLPLTPPEGSYERLAHWDQGWSNYHKWDTPIHNPWCPDRTEDENEIVVHSTDATTLKNAVSDLTVFGNTAIDLGVKWGVALLDPAMRPVVNGLVASGTAPAIVQNRPLDWDDEDGILKVVVVMTDGANTTEYDLEEEYKWEQSTIWFHREYAGQPLYDVPEDRISIQYEGMDTPLNFWDDEFFHLDSPHWDRWDDHPRGTDRNLYRSGALAIAQASGPGEGIFYDGDVYHASWQDIFANWNRKVIYNHFFNEPYSRGAITHSTYVASYYADESIVGPSAADDRLSDICDAAKDENIVIYAVAFEAPSQGQTALQDCASSASSHYFDVQGTDIAEAFSAIASDIRALKLVQ